LVAAYRRIHVKVDLACIGEPYVMAGLFNKH